MPRVSFSELPDEARLWVFAADRALDADERASLLRDVDAFLDEWAAHGAPLTSGREIRHEQFLLVAVDERPAGASGCSIDALSRRLSDLEARLGVSLHDHAHVQFREGDAVRRVSRPAFERLASAGRVTPETVVFDNSVSRLSAVRKGKWETPARASWHGRAFFGMPRTPA